MPKNDSTKERILDAADVLFAERGFAETSLRVITARADVNLASVNYHFGSKKSLIQAVFDRYLRDFTDGLANEMTALESDGSELEVEAVIGAVLKPLAALDVKRRNGISIFMRLLGRAYAETQGHLRTYVTERYGHVLARFTRLLHQSYPQLEANQIFWRLHYMLGSLIFTLAGSDALREISATDFQQPVSMEQVVEQMIPFLAAGMKAN